MRRLFGEVDEDGNGKVDFEEFLKLVRQRGKEALQKVNDMTKAIGEWERGKRECLRE